MEKTKKAYKVMAVREGGILAAIYDGSRYDLGAERVDSTPHGLSVHATAFGAIQHGVPSTSTHATGALVLVEVAIDAAAPLVRGGKTLVQRLTPARVLRALLPGTALRGFSAQRYADARHYMAQGWGRFRVVGEVRRGSPSPAQVAAADRGKYTIECRPASSGRWGKCVEFRAVPRDSH